MIRCSYIYGDGERCVWEGRIEEGEMCQAHVIVTKQRENVRRSNKRIAAKRKAERPAVRDQSAPWCVCEDKGQMGQCARCGKPTYASYMARRQGVG